jgi:4'-phosphopantetheinyl transferase EntD
MNVKQICGVIFSLKEAAFKALHPLVGRHIAHKEVQICLTPSGGALLTAAELFTVDGAAICLVSGDTIQGGSGVRSLSTAARSVRLQYSASWSRYSGSYCITVVTIRRFEG